MLYEVTPLTQPPPRVVPLPVMVDPMEGEALISWCHRLGARLGLSPAQTACMLGAAASDPAWWQRPISQVLSAISMRSGVTVDRLRAMTLLDWKGLSTQKASVQIVGRSARRLHTPRATGNQLCVACPQCLAEDKEPWLRLDWLTGWATVCPVHRVVLIERCWKCGFLLRVPALKAQRTPTVGSCANCGASHCSAPSTSAHPAILSLQERVFEVMREGRARLPVLGTSTWSTVTSVIELILWTVWASPGVAHDRTRDALCAGIAEDLHLAPYTPEMWRSAYGAMVISAWLLQKPAERWSILVGEKTGQSHPGLEPLRRLPARQRERLEHILSFDGAAHASDHRTVTIGGHCVYPIGHYPSAEILKQRAGAAMNDTFHRKLVAIARICEGATVDAVVQETGLPFRTAYRWWCRYRPDRFSQDTLQTQSTAPTPQRRLSKV